ncbi:MAG: hypothetical protein U0270_42180 [Labilithrix sp.]
MRLLLVLPASVIVAIAACGEDFEDCYGEDLIACTCAGGVPGYATCANGSYRGSPCVCDGTTPGIDAGKDSGTSEAGACTREAGVDDSGALKKDFEPCANADECEGCRCELFASTLLCTRSCRSDAECTSGCNPRGICRNP